MKTTQKNRRKLFFLLPAVTGILIACSDNTSNSLPPLGKYKMYSDDPQVNRFIAFENNYIEINKDNTIVYNTTINTKPKFNFKGSYTYDEKSNTLNIAWYQGKLPNALKIETEGKKYIIRIGESTYKKE